MSIIDYDILEDYSVEELKIKIFKKQEEGWELQGNGSIRDKKEYSNENVFLGRDTIYSQTMILMEKVKMRGEKNKVFEDMELNPCNYHDIHNKSMKSFCGESPVWNKEFDKLTCPKCNKSVSGGSKQNTISIWNSFHPIHESKSK